MKHYYEVRRFRQMNPNSTVREGVGSHKYDVSNDAEAIDAAKRLHSAFYDGAVDQISVWELESGKDDRLVFLIDGPNA